MIEWLPQEWDVVIVSRNYEEAKALGYIRGSSFTDSLWLVVLKNGGGFMEVPNPDIRMHANWTAGITKYK
jgi:hypothetical protein